MSIELHWTEVDHVTTIWAEAPAPFRAGLYFRTGRADETLATSGQTHLIEHLALSTMGVTARNHNGFVGGAVTGFITIGTAQEAFSFLTTICNALTSLPGDRLEGEKQVLAAEGATRPYDFRSNLLTWRYGAAGYGLLGMPEFGIRKASLEQLHDYRAQRFTNGNAVLWLSGPPPADLCLNLPDGKKQPLRPLAPIQKTFPSYFVDDACGGVAAGAIVPRVSASTIFCEIATRRLREQLRANQSVSYAPSVFYDHLTTDAAHLVLYADSNKERRAELANAFGQVFEKLNQVDESEVETARQQLREYWSGPLAPPPAERSVMEIQRAAMDWILGREFESMDTLATELSSVTVDDVSAFGREVRATAMLALPSEGAWRPWVGKRAPASIAPAVQGKETSHRDAPIRRERLVYSPDGVSVFLPDGSHCTVRYSDLAAALSYDDGGVHLIGSDAATVTIEPTLWRDGQNVSRKIRERVPAHLFFNLHSRPANAIPKPTTTAWQRLRALLTRR